MIGLDACINYDELIGTAKLLVKSLGIYKVHSVRLICMHLAKLQMEGFICTLDIHRPSKVCAACCVRAFWVIGVSLDFFDKVCFIT
jgi:hypothetical protein